MSKDERYNGWTNYQTWAMSLWGVTDDSEMALEAYRNAEADKYFSREERATLDLADSLKELYTDPDNGYAPALLNEASMYSDILEAALSSVNWHELARHMIDDLSDEDKGETYGEDTEPGPNDWRTGHEPQIT